MQPGRLRCCVRCDVRVSGTLMDRFECLLSGFLKRIVNLC